jgi:hypothetical protein
MPRSSLPTPLRAAAAAALIALLAAPAGAQIIRGTVIDSLTGEPIPGATVAMRAVSPDTSVAGAVTDSLGRFSILAPHAGFYLIAARKIGYIPLAGIPRQLDSGSVRTVQFQLTRTTVMLDSVIATERNFGGLTPGSVWFAKHAKEGKGVFFHGLDVSWSKKRACDYFAAMPGLTWSPRVTGSTGIPCTHEADGNISANSMIITSNTSSRCLAGRVDRDLGIVYMDSASVYVRPINDRSAPITAGTSTFSNTSAAMEIPFDQVKAVEVYRNRDELPRDLSIPNEAVDVPTSVAAAQAAGAQLTAFQGCAWIQMWTSRAWDR